MPHTNTLALAIVGKFLLDRFQKVERLWRAAGGGDGTSRAKNMKENVSRAAVAAALCSAK